MKHYAFHWHDGTITYAKGATVQDAAISSGIGQGALVALDYYDAVDEVPLNEKQFIFVDLNGKETQLGRHTMFVEQALAKLSEGEAIFDIIIVNHRYHIQADIKPFEVTFQEILETSATSTDIFNSSYQVKHKGLTIQKATQELIDTVLDLESFTYEPESLICELYYMHIIWENDYPVALLGYSEGYLRYLEVAPEARNRGIAKAILKFMFSNDSIQQIEGWASGRIVPFLSRMGAKFDQPLDKLWDELLKLYKSHNAIDIFKFSLAAKKFMSRPDYDQIAKITVI